ncbi:MAG: hypothetical protein NTU53_11575 [Planctomycetota bacterium]|nr:hypothetical protein [Planctomycetota bacterium]
MSNGTGTADASDFSLVLGGPLYQLFRRAHLSGDALELLRRRIVAIVLLTWLPLLVLSAVQGSAWRGAVKMPFFLDVDAHVRFLLALPVLVLAEMVIHQRMRPLVRQFVERGLVTGPARERFDAAIASAMRLRNSIVAEALLIAFVYLVGVLYLWRTHMAIDVTSWMGAFAGGRLQPSLAGWWYGCVSVPLFQFILLRWYFRIFIWARFLWQVSRIDLALIPTHPDRCAGLGFLSNISFAFAPLLFAQGALLAGLMADRIFFAGARLLDFKVEIAVVVGFAVVTVVGPLLLFVPILSRARRAGLSEYGGLAHRYAREFDQKWLRGGAAAEEQLLGSADIQSLADMGSSLEVIREMKLAPITRQTLIQLAVATLLPVLPLLLTMVSLEELLSRLLKVVF